MNGGSLCEFCVSLVDFGLRLPGWSHGKRLWCSRFSLQSRQSFSSLSYFTLLPNSSASRQDWRTTCSAATRRRRKLSRSSTSGLTLSEVFLNPDVFLLSVNMCTSNHFAICYRYHALIINYNPFSSSSRRLGSHFFMYSTASFLLPAFLRALTKGS